MIGIDTNVLVRYIVQDDAVQSKAASDFIENECSKETPGFVDHLVICEVVWVLRRCYRVSNNQITRIIKQILKTAQFKIQDTQTVWKALRKFELGKADFADCLIAQINSTHGCSKTVTFDIEAAKTNGFFLLKT